MANKISAGLAIVRMRTSTDSFLAHNTFQPCPWLRNAHLQTLIGGMWPTAMPVLIAEELELADGDAIGTLRSGSVSARHCVLIMHGLEGSINSPHIRQLLQVISSRGWCGILLQARGAAQRPNRLQRGYHSGDWGDASALTQHLFKQGAASVSAIGISLGANQLLKWLGESGDQCPLLSAVAVCAPFELASCVEAFESGFARFYQKHLLHLMRASMWAKRHLLGLKRKTLKKIRTIREFDDHITAPLHGFASVDDYYQRVSCRQFLGGIQKKCLIIQANDDPFVPSNCIPEVDELSASTLMLLTEHGGHVGFLSGWLPRPWLPQTVAQWFDTIFHSLAPASGADAKTSTD